MIDCSVQSQLSAEERAAIATAGSTAEKAAVVCSLPADERLAVLNSWGPKIRDEGQLVVAEYAVRDIAETAFQYSRVCCPT